ncbi:MAG: hypothetical protein ACOX52_20200 [Verrucomicrobiota bacterium]|jgi:asparagine synthetase B (glutamine-hydrolysing)
MTLNDVSKSFVKNEEDYYFIINATGDVITDSAPTIQSDDGNTKIYLSGTVYNQNLETLLKIVETQKDDFVNHLEGSFVLFVSFSDEFLSITDSFNSKKAYYVADENSISISNDIDTFKKNNLSIEGIGSFLANGVMINGCTIFHGVRSFSRATINKISFNEINTHVYKKYAFKYDSNIIQNKLKEELQNLIVESISKRYSVCDIPSLSLSAGWDARGILGVLGEELQTKNVECFSYANSQEPKPNTDGAISNYMASLYGYDHEMVTSYNGDLVSFIENNALHGKGIANICFEIDAWLSLENKGFSDIFVGDEMFGWLDLQLSSKDDVLESVYIMKSPSIQWFKRFMSQETLNEISDYIDKNADELYEQTNSMEDFHDKKDILYLEHRINNVLMPWREHFASKAGFVHNPFLDENIMELMTIVPPSLRKDKKLFKMAISELYPELFSIPKATDPGHIENWRNEIVRSEEELIKMVEESTSYLDSIISKDNVIKLIKTQKSKLNKANTFIIRGVNYVRKRNVKIDKLLNKVIGKRKPPVDSTTVLIRILVLRTYLKVTDNI